MQDARLLSSSFLYDIALKTLKLLEEMLLMRSSTPVRGKTYK